MPQKTLSCWPLAFSAGLLGVGQNGLAGSDPCTGDSDKPEFVDLGGFADAWLNAVPAVFPMVGKANCSCGQ